MRGLCGILFNSILHLALALSVILIRRSFRYYCYHNQPYRVPGDFIISSGNYKTAYQFGVSVLSQLQQ